MTNQNNDAQAAGQNDIAQRLRKQADIDAAEHVTHGSGGADHRSQRRDRTDGLRRALESRDGYVKAIKDARAALASAPVADAPLTHRCANCGSVFQGAGCPSCRLAAPVASVPGADQQRAWRADDPDLMLALGRQFLSHPQTRQLIGREALVLRCVRAALASAPVAGKTREAVDYVRGGALNFDAHPDGAPVAGEVVARDDGVLSTLNRPESRAKTGSTGGAQAPVAEQPFMYGIMGPDGKAHFEEFCVSGDRDELQAEVVDHLNRDNPEDGLYSVVSLFRNAAPQASAEDGREALAHKVNPLTAESLEHRSAAGHLSALVDELRGCLIEARQAMTDIQQAFVPAFDTPETLTMVPNEALAPFCAVLDRLRGLDLPLADKDSGQQHPRPATQVA